MNALNTPTLALTPTMGTWQGQVHLLPVRVYYEDTDAAGIVYHANYLRYAERGRTEMLRTIGIEMTRLKEETGVVFVLHAGDVTYRKPARLDDILVVETALTKLGAATVYVRQIIRRGADELVRFTADVACMDQAGKAVRLSGDLKAKLAAYICKT